MTFRFLLPCLFASFAWAGPHALPTHDELKAAFVVLDQDGNGGIDESEWRTASLALLAGTDQGRRGTADRAKIGRDVIMREIFPEFDPQQPDPMSREKFLALRDTVFRAADVDHDDAISFVEYEILFLLRRTGWQDRNDDGRIAISELRQILENAFPLLDRNHDSVLTEDEATFLAPNHRLAMDPRRTGRITANQLVNGYRWLLGADIDNRNL